MNSPCLTNLALRPPGTAGTDRSRTLRPVVAQAPLRERGRLSETSLTFSELREACRSARLALGIFLSCSRLELPPPSLLRRLLPLERPLMARVFRHRTNSHAGDGRTRPRT